MPTSATKLQQTESGSETALQPLSLPKIKLLSCLLLIAVTMTAYIPVLHSGFIILDDVDYILGNPPVRAGLTWATVKWSFTSVHAGYWHPLTWLSHALDCQLFGVHAAGHHFVSLILHAANVVVLFLLLAEATGLTWPSLIVAALFALHPVNVESIAWAAERKNVLSMLFFLLALWAYGRYARKSGVGRYAAVAGLFVLGLMAKPQIITLPCVLLLWDYWPLRRMFADDEQPNPSGGVGRSFTYLVLEKIPLFVLAAAGSALTVWSQRVGNAMRALDDYPLLVRLENAVVSYGKYLANTFWPTRLAPMYPHPENTLPAWQVILSAAILIALTVTVIRLRKRRYLAMGWFWFVGTLVPMIGIVQVGRQGMADRFAYIPMIGVFVALVWLVADVGLQKGWNKSALGVAAVAVLGTLGALTYHQLTHWRDAETLWRYTVSVTRNNYTAHDMLGLALDKQGRVGEAITEFRLVETLHKYPPQEIMNLGMFEQANGYLTEALDQYAEVFRQTNDPKLRSSALAQFAEVKCDLKDYAEGRRDYQQAMELNPDNADALVGMGLLAWRDGSPSQAAQWFSRAVNIEPRGSRFLLLADALRVSGQIAEAQSAQDAAAKISSDLAAAHQIVNQKYAFFGIDARAASHGR